MKIKYPELFYDLVYKYLSLEELNNAPGLKDDGNDIERIKEYLSSINKVIIYDKVIEEYNNILNKNTQK